MFGQTCCSAREISCPCSSSAAYDLQRTLLSQKLGGLAFAPVMTRLAEPQICLQLLIPLHVLVSPCDPVTDSKVNHISTLISTNRFQTDFRCDPLSYLDRVATCVTPTCVYVGYRQ